MSAEDIHILCEIFDKLSLDELLCIDKQKFPWLIPVQGLSLLSAVDYPFQSHVSKGTKRCAARGDELRATFLRRAWQQYVPARSRAGSRSKVQFRWPVQGRGLLNGSCLGAVAESRIVGEAYLVRSSSRAGSRSKVQFRWPVQGRGLLNGSCLGAVAEGRIVGEAYLVRSSDRIMLGRWGPKL
ncbi:hypothetical protein HPB52_003148 [Rhipicephalus sanguineus]|uniref:Uncharacterized protein n=1 Tax=Rhipicephalus sanguineus TaxID=34632 RepID=A0A9D4PDB2_RHISA|nr:hypothetical protein HPB52_003148 [Rhipicephalus sanguineus]